MKNKIIIETTLKELEKHGLVICECGHPPNNHFLQFDDNDKSCSRCNCPNYRPKILLGKKAGQVEPELKPACENCEDLQVLFDLQNKRMLEADKYWQEKTGNSNMLPDLGQLLKFLMDRIIELESKSV
jgi:hypothetical protein